MKTNAKTIAAAFLFGCAAFSVSCKKNDSNNPSTAQTAPYNMYMTDAPAAQYSAVYVNITGAQVYSGGTWTSLNINAGTYNLLSLSNGKDTLIASGNVVAGAVTQVKLLLAASGHSVMVGGVSYPMTFSNTDEAGLTLNVQSQTASTGSTTSSVIDFDAGLSVVATGNNTYKLRPILRRVVSNVTGVVKGTIAQATVEAAVLVQSAQDSAYSFSSTFTGQFMVQGLAAGTYNVTIYPATPYAIKTFTAVVVAGGSVTDLGSITL